MEEKVWIINKMGLKLAAVLHRPVGEGKFPVVIILPGFTGYKEVGHIEGLARELDRRGIGAIRFDPSGIGESEGTVKNDYRVTNYLSDIETVCTYLGSLDWVDTDRLGVSGQSLGGTLAIIVAKDNPHIKAVAVISAPVKMGGADDLKGKLVDWKAKGYAERSTTKYGSFKVPWAFMEDAMQYNALDYIRSIHVPIFVVWGTADQNVPALETKQLYDRANQPKEYWELEGMDHFPQRNLTMLAKLVTQVADFFEKNL